jgi:hypothetical protein
MGISDDLEQLANLFNRGLLTREQFDAAKSRLFDELQSGSSDPAAISVANSNAGSGDASGTHDVHVFDPNRNPVDETAFPHIELGSDESGVSRIDSLTALVRANKGVSVAVGVIACIIVAALIVEPSPPPRPVATVAPSPQAQAQAIVTRCVSNMGDWIDEFERNYERVYRTFGVQSLEAQAIQELSTQYYSRSFQIGADRAIAEVHPRVIAVCSSNPEFAERIARFSPK